METTEAYLDRKHEELRLLNGCLRSPLSLGYPQSIGEIIERKFQLTASIRAERELQDWTATETAWAPAGRGRIGPFEFKYDYQRADLKVEGPSFYEFGGELNHDTVYTLFRRFYWHRLVSSGQLKFWFCPAPTVRLSS